MTFREQCVCSNKLKAVCLTCVKYSNPGGQPGIAGLGTPYIFILVEPTEKQDVINEL